ncbi:hypothetical protein FEDK69T_17090 [Flavobacterium enshiense DK69]|uniref:Outer membrane protein beta-barrel domain-containing protein n=1 Tax=Flavobacterium enshiense DK69 TaxID=1107311 RepID=V6SET6_9FLAO|nr:outer membrane beta-barrel protein [Flavobacterium enshiense]ESU22930.1 hypothetical protein FEDK69T_17090 [Flavobacterium enshiense DK69]KGO93947.1 hypothetical protein Q767_13440 [Flavobacterium enshiense DK69]
MKKIILSIAAVFAFGFANAQEETKSEGGYGFTKGDMYIEGSIKVRTDDDSSLFSFNPKFGYMIQDQIAVGADLDLGSSSQDRVGALDPNVKNTNWGIGAFARYNVLELNDKRFVAYGEVGAGYSYRKTEFNFIDPIPGGDHEDNTSAFKANLDLGVNYFITKQLAAVFIVSNVISYNNEDPTDPGEEDVFKMDINLFNNPFAQAQFGLLYKF